MTTRNRLPDLKKMMDDVVNYHIPQSKQEKAYKIVITNLHPLFIDDGVIKCALKEKQFIVRNVSNVINKGKSYSTAMSNSHKVIILKKHNLYLYYRKCLCS